MAETFSEYRFGTFRSETLEHEAKISFDHIPLESGRYFPEIERLDLLHRLRVLALKKVFGSVVENILHKKANPPADLILHRALRNEKMKIVGQDKEISRQIELYDQLTQNRFRVNLELEDYGTQYLEIAILNLGNRAIASSSLISLIKNTEDPVSVFIPGCNNDIGTAAVQFVDIARALEEKGFAVIVSYPTSHNGGITPEFADLLLDDKRVVSTEVIARVQSMVLKELLGGNVRVDLYSHSTGGKLSLEMLTPHAHSKAMFSGRVKNLIMYNPAGFTGKTPAESKKPILAIGEFIRTGLINTLMSPLVFAVKDRKYKYEQLQEIWQSVAPKWKSRWGIGDDNIVSKKLQQLCEFHIARVIQDTFVHRISWDTLDLQGVEKLIFYLPQRDGFIGAPTDEVKKNFAIEASRNEFHPRLYEITFDPSQRIPLTHTSGNTHAYDLTIAAQKIMS